MGHQDICTQDDAGQDIFTQGGVGQDMCTQDGAGQDIKRIKHTCVFVLLSLLFGDNQARMRPLCHRRQ